MKFKMATVARLTGFKPDLLRSWERRHGLLKPDRTEGGHRLYTEDDLAVLRAIRRMLDEGRSIGGIAETGRDALLSMGMRREGEESLLPSRRVMDADEAQARRAELIRAAVQVDQTRLMSHLRALFSGFDVRHAVKDVLAPASVRIGELWAEGVCSVAGEHLASSAFRGRLLDILSREIGKGDPRSGLRVVCAGFPGEHHENPALFWALEQVWRGRRVIWLGTDLPFEELDDACERLSPDEVHVSVTTVEVYEASRERFEIFRQRWEPRVKVVLGGRGAPKTLEAAAAG